MKIGRRGFLGIAAGLAAGTLASPAPWRAAGQLIQAGQDPAGLPKPPGGAIVSRNTVSGLSPGGPGITVLSAGDRLFGVRPNPEHPLGAGGLDSLALAEVYSLYAPGRFRGPLVKNAAGGFTPISWSKAQALVMDRLAQAGESVAAVCGGQGASVEGVLAAFLARLGSSACHVMPSEGLAVRRALSVMEAAGQPGYDADNADLIVALGADLTGSFPASLHMRRALAQGGARLVVAGPKRPLGVLEWVPARDEAMARLALSIAWHILDRGAAHASARSAPDFAAFAALVRARFSPEATALATGVSPAETARLADLLLGAGRPVVAAGASAGQGASQAALLAGLGLNLLLGRVNAPGGMYLVADAPHVFARPETTSGGRAELVATLRDVSMGLAKAADVLLIHQADPAAALPGAELMARGVAKSGFKIYFGAFPNATSALCDLILPALLPLERASDVETPYGLAFACLSATRPLSQPVVDAKCPGDFLLETAKRMGKPLGYSSMRHVLRQRAARLEGAGGYIVAGRMPWEVLAGDAQPAARSGVWNALTEGLAWANPTPVAAKLSFGAAFLDKALFPEPWDAGFPVSLVLDGSLAEAAALPGVLADTAHPRGVNGDACAVRVNRATAAGLRLREGDAVRVRGAMGQFAGVAVLDETVIDGCVAVRLEAKTEGGGGAVMAGATPMAGPVGGAFWAGSKVDVVKA